MKIRDSVFAVFIVAFICLVLMGAKPNGVTHFTSIWIGDRTQTADVTPGANDLYVYGTSEFDGAARFDGATTFNSSVTLSSSFYYKKVVTATTTSSTLTAAQTGTVIDTHGTTYVAGTTNGNNNTTLNITLPAWASGLEYTFVIGTAVSTYIVPASTAKIVNYTDSTGDKIWADAIGESITLVATGVSSWTPVGYYGTWTDGN